MDTYNKSENTCSKCENSGFTLVEMMVTLVIIAVLAAVIVPSLTGYIDNTRKKLYVIEAQEVKRSVELYLMDNIDADISDMELAFELVYIDITSDDHFLKDYLVTGCTKGARIENISLRQSAATVTDFTYRVDKYRIEIEGDKITVTEVGKQ